MEESRNGLSIEVVGDDKVRPKGSAAKEVLFDGDIINIVANHNVVDSSYDDTTPWVYPETHLYSMHRSAVNYLSVEHNPDDSFWYLTVYTDAICYEFRYINSDKGKMIDDYSSIYKWLWGTFPDDRVLYNIKGPIGQV